MPIRVAACVLLLTLVSSAILGCSPTRKAVEDKVVGVYVFESNDDDRGRGPDVLVLNRDHSYFHFYASLSPTTLREHQGKWDLNTANTNVILRSFVAWELDDWGQRASKEDFRVPEPSDTGLAIQRGWGSMRLVVNADRGDSYVKVK